MTTKNEMIAKKLIEHKVCFYHSENLRHFRAYCRNRALICRKELIESDPQFHTSFYSDGTDEKLGVLGRVFGNMYDFGSVFSRAQNTVPNVYGPILLVFRSEVFMSMSDICITKVSIVKLHERWRSLALTSDEELDTMLSGDDYGSPINQDYHYAELSCANARISLDFLEKIIVEPICTHGVQLLDLVRDACKGASITCPIIERRYGSLSNRNLLRDLVSICDSLEPAPTQKEWKFDQSNLPSGFSKYSPERKNRVCLWTRYFFYGTIDEVRSDLILDNDDDDRTICQLCDPGGERPPAMVHYQPWSVGDESEPRIDLGRCDWCNGISIRCRECGEISSIYEHEYDQPISCSGECGLRFRIESYYDPRDGGGYEEIEILPDGDPNAWNGLEEH